MNRPHIVALIIACCLATLPVTIKIKIYRSLSRVDSSREDKVVDFLAERGFKTVKDHADDPQFFLIHAQRDRCSMDLREVTPRGYDQTAVRTVAAGRRFFFVDNGSVSAEQPAWRTWSHLYIRRFAGFLGVVLEKRLTFAVISNASCTDLDWTALRTEAPK